MPTPWRWKNTVQTDLCLCIYEAILSVSLQLIDSFAWEIGTLKKEMGKKPEPAEGDHKTDILLGWVFIVSVYRTLWLCVVKKRWAALSRRY